MIDTYYTTNDPPTTHTCTVQDLANPSGMLMGAVMMLRHLGLGEDAMMVENAWLRTLEDGIHTGDVASAAHTTRRVGTAGFADAVIANFGNLPRTLRPAKEADAVQHVDREHPAASKPPAKKRLVGIDVFVQWRGDEATGVRDPNELGKLLEMVSPTIGFNLKMISNRGVKVRVHTCAAADDDDDDDGDILLLQSSMHAFNRCLLARIACHAFALQAVWSDAVAQYLREAYNVVLGERSADHGSAFLRENVQGHHSHIGDVLLLPEVSNGRRRISCCVTLTNSGVPACDQYTSFSFAAHTPALISLSGLLLLKRTNGGGGGVFVG